MGSKKAKKDCKPKSRTSPRKQKTTRDAEPEEESQEPKPRDELPEGDAAAHGDGDGEKTEKSVLCGHQNKMSRSRPSSRTTRCFTIWPILNTRTRRSKKIGYWIWPGPCSKVVSVNFHFNSFFPSVICCAMLFIFLTFFVMNLLRNIDHYPNWFRQECL